MAIQFALLYEGCPLVVHCQDVIQHVIRLCTVRNRVFLLSSSNTLYWGELDPLLLESPVLELSLMRHGVLDVDSDSEMVFLVDDNHRVWQTKAHSGLKEANCTSNWQEVPVLCDVTCPHGQRNKTERVPITRVVCNNDGVLFLTNNHELYGLGDFNEILNADVPQRIECFRGQKVMQVAAGSNFVVVLTQKKRPHRDIQPHSMQNVPSGFAQTLHNNGDALSVSSTGSEVFLNVECQKCVPERDLSLLNALHQPTLSNISKSTTETSIASSACPSEDNAFEDDLPNGKSTPIKPAPHKDSSALNFFLDLSQQQTKTLTENVTKNITTMLSEGVKTLSRHMSGSDNTDNTLVSCSNTEGSPDTNDHQSDSKGNNNDDMDLGQNPFGNNKHGEDSLEQSEASTSMLDIGSAADLQSDFRLSAENRISRITRLGSQLIDTNVWCFGSVNRGQLGTGDHIKRTCINNVLALSGQGVVKIECGKEHSAALTLDGRLFVWGSNARNQISAEAVDNFSAPREIRTNEPILDVACGHGQTVILGNDLRVGEQSHEHDCRSLLTEKQRMTLPTLPTLTDNDPQFTGIEDPQIPPHILASNEFTIHNASAFIVELRRHLATEQKFMQQALAHCDVIRQLSKKLGNLRHGYALDRLCQQYLLVVQVTAMTVRSLADCYTRKIPWTQLAIVQNSSELMSVFRMFARSYCDVLCVSGLRTLDQLVAASTVSWPSDCDKVFAEPLGRIWSYIELLYDLMKIFDHPDTLQVIVEKRRAWEKFSNEKDSLVDKAKRTVAFWEKHRKMQLVQSLQVPERRLVMDSKEVPLKALKGKTWLVLFSDVLCELQNSGTTIPLETLWTSPITDTEQRKNAFKIVTPLETNILIAASHTEKLRWLTAFEQCIRTALKRPNKAQSKVPQFRNASFAFPNDHPKYGGARYFGRWHLGQMHGIGHLVFPDGRVYNGQMSGNEINGFGRMYTPRGGIYEGDFEQGKYHGYGVLDLQSSRTMYEGNFRNGLYNGHGMLMNDEGTYIGEFVDNQKQGYGVLDETWTGNKYMGQFVEGKKQGRGICITIAGDYFEGQFQQDQLSGRGVASFEANGHGSYYEGEMSITGPCGKGVMYMTSVPVDAIAEAGEWREGRPPEKIKGMVLRGSLGGTWEDVQVVQGTLQMNQMFSKSSTLFGRLMVECDEKWHALFNDWQLQVFGVNLLYGGVTRTGLLAAAELDPKMIWGKVAVFSNNAKSKDKLKSDEFLAKNYNSVTFLTNPGSSGTTAGGKKNGKMSSAASWENMSSMGSQQIQNMTTSLTGALGSVSLKGLKLKTNSQLNLSDCQNGEPEETDLEMVQKLEKFEHLLQEVGEDRDEEHVMRSDSLLSSSSVNTGCGSISLDRFGRTQKRSNFLDFVPSFGMDKLATKAEVVAIREYLREAFKDPNHPLGVLASKINHCFYSSYGCWKIKPTPILSSHAMKEWESITLRVYTIIRHMFPGLPQDNEVIDGESVSFRFLLYPILLSEGIYSLLFVLYASKCSQRDELYRQRLIACENKHTPELAAFLKIEGKFLPIIESQQVGVAIENFKQLTDKYCPLEMLGLIEQMFKAIDVAMRQAVGGEGIAPLNSDDIIPIVIFMVIRAGVQHLGAEISLLEDLMGRDFDQIIRGYMGYCFTTLEASYQYIISDKFFG